MLIKKYVVISLLVFSLVGCNNDSADNNPDYFEVKLETKDKFGQVSTSFVEGENIEIVLNIKNISSKTRNLKFPSGKQYDFVLKNINGKFVWRWSSGMLFTQAESSYDLSQNESRVITHTWNQMTSDTGTMLPVGSYVIETDDIGIDTVSSQKLTIM